jgi:hypothetical protein
LWSESNPGLKYKTVSKKQLKLKRTGVTAQVVEHLLSKNRALKFSTILCSLFVRLSAAIFVALPPFEMFYF